MSQVRRQKPREGSTQEQNSSRHLNLFIACKMRVFNPPSCVFTGQWRTIFWLIFVKVLKISSHTEVSLSRYLLFRDYFQYNHVCWSKVWTSVFCDITFVVYFLDISQKELHVLSMGGSENFMYSSIMSHVPKDPRPKIQSYVKKTSKCLQQTSL